MQKFELESKIVWRRNAADPIEKVFYPSFYKDIMKRDSFYAENFQVAFVDADVERLHNLFLPLYFEEIVSRDDFSLSRDTITSELEAKITTKDYYKFLFIYLGGKVVATALFSLKKEGMYIGYRAWKKDLGKNLSHKATVSYWGEKIMFDYGKNMGVKFFSYGKDSHPYIGRSRIGLPLYKIKTGMRPRKPDETTPFSVETFNDNFFTDQKEPSIFFTSPGEDKYYTHCYLFYPTNSISESYLKEFEKVLSWAGITFTPINY